MADNVNYIREKLSYARYTIEDEGSGRTLHERLGDAWNYNLVDVEPKGFLPDVDAQYAFKAIRAAFTRFSETTEGAASAPSSAR